MMLLMSEEKQTQGKFFNLSPEERQYFNLKEQEEEQSESIYKEIEKEFNIKLR